MKHKLAKWSTATFLILLTTLLSYTDTVAQSGKTWSIGPEIGANFSKFGRDATDNDFKPGLAAGAFLTYSVVNTFGITGKFLFSQKGAKYNVGTTDSKITLNYLEIPLVGRFFLNKEGKFRPNIFLGPSFGFLLGGTTKVGDADAEKFTDAEKDAFNGFDFGLTGGLGLNFEILDETRLLLDARYTHGLSDVSSNTGLTGSINNQAITVTVGVSFGF